MILKSNESSEENMNTMASPDTDPSLVEKTQKQLPSWLRDELEKMNKKKLESAKSEPKLNVIINFILDKNKY